MVVVSLLSGDFELVFLTLASAHQETLFIECYLNSRVLVCDCKTGMARTVKGNHFTGSAHMIAIDSRP